MRVLAITVLLIEKAFLVTVSRFRENRKIFDIVKPNL